jgi:hypothetical protein
VTFFFLQPPQVGTEVDLAGSDFSVLKGLPAVEIECLLVSMFKGLFEVVEYKGFL